MIDKASFFKEERIFSAAYRKDTCLWGPDIADMLVHSNEGMNLWRPNFGFLPFIVGRQSPASSLSLLSSAAASPTSSNVSREIGALEGGDHGRVVTPLNLVLEAKPGKRVVLDVLRGRTVFLRRSG